MARNSRELECWHQQVAAMKQCGDVAGLTGTAGDPDHKQQHGEREIWHYPLGLADGFLYSIHVSVMNEKLEQVYMHVEPVPGKTPSMRRPWWKRLFQRPKPKTVSMTRLASGDSKLAEEIAAATVEQRRHAAAILAVWTVKQVGLQHPIIEKALAILATSAPVGDSLRAEVTQLAEQWDSEDESGDSNAADKISGFTRARVATTLLEAFSGELDNAAYEAGHATGDEAQVRDVVLAALAEMQKA